VKALREMLDSRILRHKLMRTHAIKVCIDIGVFDEFGELIWESLPF